MSAICGVSSVRWKMAGAHQGRARSGLFVSLGSEAKMRRVCITVFLWCWLTLLGVGLVLVSTVGRGVRYGTLLHLTIHDFLLYSVAGAIFCYFISSYLTKPLFKLGQAAASIADGRLETRVDPSLKNRKDEIAGLARNFDFMAERIEALVTEQRRLLGDVSHELRSPLSRLTVALGLAKQGPPEEAAGNLERGIPAFPAASIP